MKFQSKHDVAAVVSGLMFAASIATLVWPAVSHADTRLHKAGRGLAAMTTAFLEIPGNIKVTTEREGAPAGWTEGFAKGLGMTLIRPAIGVYELVTAPIPAPPNFEPILEPEYPWSYFGSGEGSRTSPGLAQH
jgi:putative exosortase-associated protein (TIGR04073 family)